MEEKVRTFGGDACGPAFRNRQPNLSLQGLVRGRCPPFHTGGNVSGAETTGRSPRAAHAARSGENPGPTVIVGMKEGVRLLVTAPQRDPWARVALRSFIRSGLAWRAMEEGGNMRNEKAPPGTESRLDPVPPGLGPSAPMSAAFTLARQGEGRTAPNPPVGAVVVRDGEVVGRGFHPRAGEAHAEIFALREAGARAQGATLYVTLEPCPTEGRTPPCTEAILASGITRVIVAAVDPNPRVSGRGIERLVRAGIQVELGDGEPEARRLLRFYAKHVQKGRPYVIYKYAMSLDGKVTTEEGRPTAVSGPASLERVHALRDRVDAVLVGVGTALSDDPRLTVRTLPDGRTPDRQPLRIVADSHLRLPTSARLLAAAPSSPPLIACLDPPPRKAAERLRAAGAEILPLPPEVEASSASHLSAEDLFARLGERGIMSVLVEGGPTLAAALLARDLVDEVLAVVSLRLVGGIHGQGPLGVCSPESLAHFDLRSVYPVGTDLWLKLERGEPAASETVSREDAQAWDGSTKVPDTASVRASPDGDDPLRAWGAEGPSLSAFVARAMRPGSG